MKDARERLLLCLFFLLISTTSAFAYYNPEAGRFMQRDPLGYIDSMNAYEYVRSNSLVHVDPFGDTYELIMPGGTPPPGGSGSSNLKCTLKKSYWLAKIAAKSGSFGGNWPDFLPAKGGMPFRHCVWNCKMTIRKGRKYAQEMSDRKEELDNMWADYGDAMKDAGCWDSLSEDERSQIAEAARSADQPSDRQDNEVGRQCGEHANKRTCNLADGYTIIWYPNLRGKPFNNATDYCRDCCARRYISPGTPDGPGVGRDWGPRGDDFPGYTPPVVYY